jgi:signal peptidase II
MDSVSSHRKLALGTSGALFALDQLVKYIVMGPLGLVAEGQKIYVLPIFDLTMVWNFGVSLGLFTAKSEPQRWALVALTAAIAAFVARWLWTEKNRSDAIGLGMILGGALGNILDRVRFGHVVDYADLHFGAFRPFLVFNVADAAITVGVLILLARAFLGREPKAQVETENA